MKRSVIFLVTLCLLVMTGSTVIADDKELGWKDTAELSLVATSGNSESETFGFSNTLLHLWDNAEFQFLATGLKAESTSFDRYAVGVDPMNFTTFEDSTTNETAENYLLSASYSREITESFSWLAGAGWDRNRFAGIDNRITVFGGVRNVWRDDDKVKFRTNYLLTYTDQEDVVPNPALEDSFLGAQVGWDYLHAFNDSTTYENIWVVDLNFDESDDWRSKMVNAVSVAMSKRMALRVSVTWFYDNLPALQTVTLFDQDPALPGAVAIGTVPFELDETDILVTTSLVVDF